MVLYSTVSKDFVDKFVRANMQISIYLKTILELWSMTYGADFKYFGNLSREQKNYLHSFETNQKELFYLIAEANSNNSQFPLCNIDVKIYSRDYIVDGHFAEEYLIVFTGNIRILEDSCKSFRDCFPEGFKDFILKFVPVNQ